MTKYLIMFVLILSLPISSGVAQNTSCKNEVISHSGGTDKCGCHYNRKTNTYHCHTRKQRGGDCPA